jgi:hypothetical protein
MPVSPSDAEVVRAFRRQAAEVRRALSAPRPAAALEVVGGYIQAEGWLQRTRRLSVPIRRIHLPHDKASFLRSCQILERYDDPAVAAGARTAGEAYRALLAELEVQTTLGGRKVARGEMLRAWLDATVFYDSHDKSQPYEEMLEEMAAAVLQLDEAAASALGEPVILPPPTRTPPPPPEPRGWRHFLQSLFGHRPEAARKSSP